jgi:hypothetical protein
VAASIKSAEIGAVLLPVWAAIGAIAAMVTDCTIIVEKVEE